jgi:acyl-CoA synthetase (AMP-forming)/AMP-acid ligase II
MPETLCETRVMTEVSPANEETLADVLRARAAATPDATAFVLLEGGSRACDSLTFARLDRRARAIGRRLLESGAGGRAVLLLHPPGLDFIASFFGCLYAGAVAVPGCSTLLAERNRARLLALLRDSGASLILGGRQEVGALDEGAGLDGVTLSVTASVDDDEGVGWTPERRARDDVAYLQYTSGSTSKPRGVVVRHGNMMHNLHMMQTAFGTRAGLTSVSWLPHFHDMGLVGMVQQTVYAGMCTAFMSPLEFIRRPAKWLRAVSDYGAYVSGGPNFAYDLCVERVKDAETADLDLSRWRRAFNGSEPVRAETLERFAARFAGCGFRAESFYPCYGLAEATLFVTGRAGFGLPKVRTLGARDGESAGLDSESSPASHAGARRAVSCGRAWGGGRVLIVDPRARARVASGEVGEIWVSGPHVAGGHVVSDEETRSIFGARLADTGEGPFLRTGDLGCIIDGELYVTGRLKDVLILRGKNHYPNDIEATVASSHPALRPNCGAAFSVEVNGQEELVVFQEVRSRTPYGSAEEIRAAVRQALAETHLLRPHAVVLLRPNVILKTSSGKVRRSACRAEFLENAHTDKVFTARPREAQGVAV